MTTSFLHAVAMRLSDCSLSAGDTPPPRRQISADELSLLLAHLEYLACGRVAAVSKEWSHAVHDQIHARPRVDKSHLSRRIKATTLSAFARHCLGPHTLSLDLANMRNMSGRLLVEVLCHNADLPSASPRMPNLHTLNLSAAELDDESFLVLGWCCAHGMPLRHLHLWATDEIGDAAMRYFAMRTSSWVSFEPLREQQLFLSMGSEDNVGNEGNEAREEPEPLQLELLDLRMCGEVSGRGVEAVVSVAPWLTDVRLKGLRAIDDAVFGTLGASCPQLTALDASGATCSNDGVCALAKGCGALRTVVLSGCKRVSNPGVVALAEHCAHLRLLDLQGCATVGTEAAVALAEHSTELHTVSFQCCAALTEEGFLLLCRSCRMLKHITLKLCAVSDTAVEAIRAERGPSLTVVALGSRR